MDLARLEIPETERQLSFHLSHLNVNQPLTGGEDPLVEAQQKFEVHVAREKHLQSWSEKLQLETASSNVTTEDLIDETLARLVNRCQRFQNDCLEPEDRTGPYGDMPSIEAFIFELADKYRVKHGEKAQGTTTALKSLHRMLNTMHAHKTLLQIIPSQNNYASIIYGVVQTFLKASANHSRITETIGRVIAEVNDLVAHAHSLFELYPNQDVRRIATTLYCHIFDFLEKVFKWYESRWHRFKRSFNDDTLEILLDLTVDIKRYTHILDRRAVESNMIESRVTSLRVEQIYEILKIIPSVWVQQFFQGKDLVHGNMERERALSDGHDASAYETMLTDSLPSLQLDGSNLRLGSSGDDSSRNSRDADEESEDSATIYVEERIIQTLQKWLPEPRARFMWIEGPQTTGGQSPLGLIARSIAYSTRQCGGTVLYHACSIPEGIETFHELPGTTGFRYLLQSLNNQLGSFARSEQAASKSELLYSQTSASTDDLTSSFKQNLAMAPPLLLCIIEEFQCLDDPFEDNTHLRRFFQVLRTHDQSINQDKLPGLAGFKVLISTSGHSKTLREELEPEEICYADHDPRAQLHPGQAAPGRRPITSNLRLINSWMNSQTPD